MLTHVRLAVSEAGPKDGGLVVMEGSAPLFEKFFKEFPPDRTKGPLAALHYDFYPFQDEDLKWYEARGCKIVKICAEPGDLVLWDSDRCTTLSILKPTLSAPSFTPAIRLQLGYRQKTWRTRKKFSISGKLPHIGHISTFIRMESI